MATETQQTHNRRRRSRTIAFFDHGERLDRPQHVRFVEPLGRYSNDKSKADEYLPFLRCCLHTITWVLATLALLGPMILIFASGVRGAQLLCSYNALSSSNAICNGSLTRPQNALLQSLPKGTTPLSTTLRELGELTDLHTSIDFMGLPMFTTVQNLSAILPELEQIYKDVPGILSSIEDLRVSMTAAHDAVETVGNADHDFRQTFLWNPEATNDFVGNIEGLWETLGNRSGIVSSAHEAALHILPLASEKSFSYLVANQYYQFLDLHQQNIEALVQFSTEAKLSLQNAISHLGRLEREFEQAGPPTYADKIRFMRLTTKWVQGVIEDVETRYRNIHQSVLSMHGGMKADLARYDAWWQSRGYVPLATLSQMLSTEMVQLTALEERSMGTEALTNEMYEQLLSEDPGQNFFRSQLEAGILNQDENWYQKRQS